MVWLDLANEYRAVPHVLMFKALRYYNIPDKIIKIIVVLLLCRGLWEILVNVGDIKVAKV